MTFGSIIIHGDVIGKKERNKEVFGSRPTSSSHKKEKAKQMKR